MSIERRRQPLKRTPKQSAGTRADVQAPHPGVRDPRSIRMADWPAAVNIAIIASFALVTAFAIISAWTASPVGPVRSWATWTDASRAISLEHPEGWTVRNIGDDEHPHVLVMRSPWVRIHVIAADALGSAANVYVRLPNDASRYRALELLHDSTGDTWATWLGELREGQTGRTVIGRHRAVWTQFRYAGEGIEGGEPMTGYRATMVDRRRAVLAGAVAPTEDWAQFKPVALRVLRSIRFGNEVGS